MFFNREMVLTEEEKAVFLRAILQLIVADGVIEAGESAIIKQIGDAYHMTSQLLDRAKRSVRTPLTDDELHLISDEPKKLELIKALCTVATVDDRLDDRESFLLIDFADRLGVSRDKLVEINDLVQDIFFLRTKNRLVMGV